MILDKKNVAERAARALASREGIKIYDAKDAVDYLMYTILNPTPPD